MLRNCREPGRAERDANPHAGRIAAVFTIRADGRAEQKALEPLPSPRCGDSQKFRTASQVNI
eukprot:6179305-Pleurochrysis_carterae.AAC.4